MAETLLVRFADNRQESLEWLTLLAEAQHQSEFGSWQDLATAATGKALILLLPASAVLLLEIELPVKNNAQLKKALPFALEELLADDVENYHLIWLRQPENKVAVAAVAHEKLAAYIALFQEAGIELDGIYPETLCLPYQPERCSLLIDSGQAILRTGQWQGGGIESQLLPQVLGKLRDEGLDCRLLHLWAKQMLPELRQALPFDIVEEPFTTPLQLFAEGLSISQEMNLLTGPYARKSKDDRGWLQWLPALGIAAIALIIQIGVLLNQHNQQQAQLSMLEMQTLDLFKQTFPDVKRIVNVKAQADQQLAELRKRGSHTGSGFMRMLYQCGELLKGNPGLKIQKLNFVNGSLQMQLGASDISQLELFKQQLQASLQVKVQSADSGANGVEAHLEIREK